MQCHRITITVRGKTESDIEDATDQAVRLVKVGYTSGRDRNDSGGFYFTVDTDIPSREHPA